MLKFSKTSHQQESIGEMNIPGYDEWKLRGPEESIEIGTEEGDICNRFPEPDEDQPRNYRPKRCNGTIFRSVTFDDRHLACDKCGEPV